MTITFTPTSELSEQGVIVFESPIWTENIYLEGTGQHIDIHHFEIDPEKMICSSESVSLTSENIVEYILTLTYDGILDESLEQVVITCSNFKNPILPLSSHEFEIYTYDTDMTRAIDYSDNVLKLDASLFTPYPISVDSFSYMLSHHHSAELSSYLISFETEIPIDNQQGCFVKYTFPEELDVSQVILDNVHG